MARYAADSPILLSPIATKYWERSPRKVCCTYVVTKVEDRCRKNREELEVLKFQASGLSQEGYSMQLQWQQCSQSETESQRRGRRRDHDHIDHIVTRVTHILRPCAPLSCQNLRRTRQPSNLSSIDKTTHHGTLNPPLLSLKYQPPHQKRRRQQLLPVERKRRDQSPVGVKLLHAVSLFSSFAVCRHCILSAC